ncbi:MAG: SCO family protein [Vibrio sp.]
MPSIPPRLIILMIGCAFALGIALKMTLLSDPQVNPNLDSTQPLSPSDPIYLQNSEGTLVNLFNDQGQRIRVIYFGFTHCPDVCPTSLSMLGAALNQVPADTLEKLRPIFITLDPKRDTGLITQQYANYFNKHIEGFSGEPKYIHSLASRYGVSYQETKLDNSALDYTIDHSSYFYFVSPQGDLIKKVPHTLSPKPLVDTMLELTKEDAL